MIVDRVDTETGNFVRSIPSSYQQKSLFENKTNNFKRNNFFLKSVMFERQRNCSRFPYGSSD